MNNLNKKFLKSSLVSTEIFKFSLTSLSIELSKYLTYFSFSKSENSNMGIVNLKFN